MIASVPVVAFGSRFGIKPVLNLIIGKGLLEVYWIKIKDVKSSDMVDIILPYTTIFERYIFVDVVFAIIFSLLVLKYLCPVMRKESLVLDVTGLDEKLGKLGVNDGFKTLCRVADKHGLLLVQNK